MQIIKPDINIDFVGKIKIFVVISFVLIIGTIVLLLTKGGINYGIDFTGGLMIQIKTDTPSSIKDIQQVIQLTSLKDAIVQDFGDKENNEFLIRAGVQEITVSKVQEELKSMFKEKTGRDIEIRRVEMVGPKIGEKLAREGLLAVFFSILFMAIYISGRFEHRWIASAIMAGALGGAVYFAYNLGISIKFMIVIAAILSMVLSFLLKFNFSLGAMIALIHDVTITLGAFILTNREMNLPVLAAFLTIIGYSLNDTIIVYDRIRENLRLGAKNDFSRIVNKSINQTLSRTILTSGTTLLALVLLYLLGGAIIRDFCFALIVGIIVGTYSSIYIASPILIFLSKSKLVKI